MMARCRFGDAQRDLPQSRFARLIGGPEEEGKVHHRVDDRAAGVDRILRLVPGLDVASPVMEPGGKRVRGGESRVAKCSVSPVMR